MINTSGAFSSHSRQIWDVGVTGFGQGDVGVLKRLDYTIAVIDMVSCMLLMIIILRFGNCFCHFLC